MANCWLPAGGGAVGVTATGSSDHVNESTADSSTSTPSSSTSSTRQRWSPWIHLGDAVKGKGVGSS